MEQVLPRLKNKITKPVKTPFTPKVLIAESTNWVTGAELPFLFKTAGCAVDIFCKERSWLETNSFYNKRISFNSQIECFELKLLELIKEADYDWIILADDPLLHRMNNHVMDDEELSKKILPLSNLQHRHMLGSKAGFAAFCKEYDILSPLTYVLKKDDDIENVVNAVDYPVIVKEDVSHAGLHTYVCNNKTELVDGLSRGRNNDNLIIQKYIKGKLIFAEALYSNGQLLSYTYSEKLKNIRHEFSGSTERLYYTNRSIEPMLIQLGKCAGLNGFASISCIYDPQKQLHYLFEADLRPNAWFAYGRFAGTDFSSAIKKIIDPEIKLPGHPILSNKKPIKIQVFYNDMRRCIYNKDAAGLLKWLINYEGRWAYIPFYDKHLLKIQLKKLSITFAGSFFPKQLKDFLKKLF